MTVINGQKSNLSYRFKSISIYYYYYYYNKSRDLIAREHEVLPSGALREWFCPIWADV